MNNTKNIRAGFIQIPFLLIIIGSALLTSLGTGVFIYESNKLSSKNNKINTIESVNTEEQKEPSPSVTLTPTVVIINKPNVLSAQTSIISETPTSTSTPTVTQTPYTPQPTQTPTPTATLTPTPLPTPIPLPTLYINSDIEGKLAELRATLNHIYNQPVAMNVINGRLQKAYQDWIKANLEIYSMILGSRYINDLNAILRAYGL
jgi:hypothetical protein